MSRWKTYSIIDSTRLFAKIEELVRSTIAVLALIPALCERVSNELRSSFFACKDPRFNFLRKSADRARVAEKTKVCLFFLGRFARVTQFSVFSGWDSVDSLLGSMSIMDCNSRKWPASIMRSASSSTKKDKKCSCSWKIKFVKPCIQHHGNISIESLNLNISSASAFWSHDQDWMSDQMKSLVLDTQPVLIVFDCF